MWFDQIFNIICISFVLFMSFHLVRGESVQWLLRHRPIRTIAVDKSGHGDFSTVQSAIDSVPTNNKYWVRIHVGHGVYREQVTIPINKPFIVLEGDGMRNSVIVWAGHNSLIQTPTFASFADNFIARDITFKNTYNHGRLMGINPRKPAVAALVFGDKSSFHKCAFYGLQDTLWDAQGRHYFKDCFIEGAVDFIFGNGQSIYEKCAISVIPGDLQAGSSGYITAQGRSSPHEKSGFVFKYCDVFGKGTSTAYLGRAWRAYSRVLFYKSTLSNTVVPRGWDAWNFAGHEGQLTFAEYDCNGLGSKTSKRVRWEKKLNQKMVAQLTNLNFIDREGWLRQQPLQRRMI